MKLNLLTVMLLGSGLFLTACGGSDNKGYTQHPIVRQFLDKDFPPLRTVVKTPIIIYQGDKDRVVLPLATDALVAQARALTTEIDYRKGPDWDHTGAFTANVDNGQLLEDIKTLLAN